VKSIHLTQFRHPLYNPKGDERSENCGPASLLMACRLKSKPLRPIPGLRDPESTQDGIDAVRYWMFTQADGTTVDPSKDGIEQTSSGPRRAPAEHLTLVNLVDLERGAENLGFAYQRVKDFEALKRLVSSSSPILFAGDPSASARYSERVGVDYSGGHVVLLLEYHGEDDRFLLCDPLSSKGPCWVDQSSLLEFAQSSPFRQALGLLLQ